MMKFDEVKKNLDSINNNVSELVKNYDKIIDKFSSIQDICDETRPDLSKKIEEIIDVYKNFRKNIPGFYNNDFDLIRDYMSKTQDNMIILSNNFKNISEKLESSISVLKIE